MRVVLDSNVLLSAYATHGLCESVVLVCLESHEVVVSEHILRETNDALRQKFKVPTSQADSIVAFLRRHCSIVKPSEVPAAACRDKQDLDVLGTAVAGRAHCLVSGDRDLLVLREYMGIPILSPRAFCDTVKRP